MKLLDNSTKSSTVYVIDDDADDFLILSHIILEKWSSIILKHYESPSDFLKNLNEIDTPDLIVLDINMPMVSGFGVLRFIKHVDKWKDVPVVFLSTASDEEQIQKAKSLGAIEYFVKPSSLEQWQSVIDKMEMMKLV